MNRSLHSLIGVAFLIASLLSGCGGGGGDGPAGSAGSGGVVPDTTPPTVSSVAPANNAVGVGTNTAISATFSETLGLPGPGALFTLEPVDLLDNPIGPAIVGTISASGTTATFTPTPPAPLVDALALSTRYRATISTAVRDVAGNALAAPFVWRFTTGAGPDITPPTVSATNPANNANSVIVNTSVSATFSEAMTNATLNATSFTVVSITTGVPATGTVSVTGNTATFTPSVPLAQLEQYRATITTAATDAAGNPLAASFTWAFTTGLAPDTTPPIVSFTAPANGETGVGTNSSVSSATFSEPMNNATLNTTSFSMVTTTDGLPVAGTVTVNGNTAAFTPLANLLPFTSYTMTVSTAARDAAGNALQNPYFWSFTTGAAPDSVPPTVSSTSPVNGATLVALNASLSATFSEPMTNSSLNTASITLVQTIGAVPVAGTVSVSANTATFTPLAPLLPTTNHTVTISTAVFDAAGNTMLAPFSWSFDTAAAPDLTAPTVVLPTSPASGATLVAQNTLVSAGFDEPMANASLNTTSFTLVRTSDSAPVAGSVSVSGNTATFTPLANLSLSTQYTATITTAVTDAAGNPLAAPVTWNFTTIGDTTPPTVLSSSLVDNATNVPVNTTVAVTFSEQMSNATLTDASVTLTQLPGGPLIAGVISVTGNTVTFAPSAPLAAGTTYRLNITTAAADAAGNPLAGAFTLNFTTSAGGIAACPTTPTNGTAVNGITPNLSVNRSSGVGPLAVFFDATATRSVSASTLDTAFRNIEYRWDFGDPVAGPAGLWSVGHPGFNSKNAAMGPMAAHVFESAGTYVVTLTASEGAAPPATFSCEITVTDPNVAFAGSTVCVSNAASWVGCPIACAVPSANCVVSLDFDNVMNTVAGSGATFKRILFRRGDTFTASSAGTISATGPGLVGAFPAAGAPATNPIVTGTVSKLVLGSSSNPAFRDWRILDLAISSVGGSPIGILHGGTSSQITIQRNVITGQFVAISANLPSLDSLNPGGVVVHPLYNELAIVENTITDSGDYGFFGAASKLMMLGNFINNSILAHGVRLQYGRQMVISNNHLGIADKTSLTIRGVPHFTSDRVGAFALGSNTLPNAVFTELGVVSDNKIVGGVLSLPLTFSSINSTDDARLRNHIAERNWMILGANAGGSFLQNESSEITIRNNLFDTTQANATQIAINITRTGNVNTPVTNGVYIHHNSVLSNKTSASPFFLVNAVNGSPTNVEIRYNLGHAPNNTSGGTAPFAGTFGAGFAASHNSSSAQIREVAVNHVDFGVPLPAVLLGQPTDWRPVAGDAIDPAAPVAVPVFSDYFGAPRTGIRDLGAVNP